jgi:hypothetical protein
MIVIKIKDIFYIITLLLYIFNFNNNHKLSCVRLYIVIYVPILLHDKKVMCEQASRCFH